MYIYYAIIGNGESKKNIDLDNNIISLSLRGSSYIAPLNLKDVSNYFDTFSGQITIVKFESDVDLENYLQFNDMIKYLSNKKFNILKIYDRKYNILA